MVIRVISIIIIIITTVIIIVIIMAKRLGVRLPFGKSTSVRGEKEATLRQSACD